jgi:lipopolysaccharide/colanic/teichoic acid biosynthesis glycosyltransferase
MTLKRLFDTMLSGLGLVCTSPILVLTGLAIFLYDFGSPFYIATRVGLTGRPFRMVKFRSMVLKADRNGVTSTSATDTRITPIGRLVRKCKLDELVQLWNVLIGEMSLVGPRPNVPSGVAVYTAEELRLLEVQPGITDFASIIFADEGEILKGKPDPDLAYDQLIRPWKSRLGLFYVSNRSLLLDLKLILLTLLALLSRGMALKKLHLLLRRLGAPDDLAEIALRRSSLVPQPLVASEAAATLPY